MEIAHMFGNQKPSALRQVEGAICRLIMRISSGSTAQDEVEPFLQEFESMMAVWETDPMSRVDYSFFARSEIILVIIILVKLINLDCR
jgi:hypothetical protein